MPCLHQLVWRIDQNARSQRVDLQKNAESQFTNLNVNSSCTTLLGVGWPPSFAHQNTYVSMKGTKNMTHCIMWSFTYVMVCGSHQICLFFGHLIWNIWTMNRNIQTNMEWTMLSHIFTSPMCSWSKIRFLNTCSSRVLARARHVP